MLSSIRRRLSRVEEALPVPLTAATFTTRAYRLARRSGMSTSSAMDTLLEDLSDGELASLGAELEQIAFGSDTAARDAAKREVLAAAGYPVWSGPPAAGSSDGDGDECSARLNGGWRILRS
jgi:hypothetical protein